MIPPLPSTKVYSLIHRNPFSLQYNDDDDDDEEEEKEGEGEEEEEEKSDRLIDLPK